MIVSHAEFEVAQTKTYLSVEFTISEMAPTKVFVLPVPILDKQIKIRDDLRIIKIVNLVGRKECTGWVYYTLPQYFSLPVFVVRLNHQQMDN